jgi:hypothetical protein
MRHRGRWFALMFDSAGFRLDLVYYSLILLGLIWTVWLFLPRNKQ